MTTTQSHTGHVTELMSAAYDGELGSEEQRAFEQHLGTCKACHAEYESFKRSLSLVKGLGETQAPDDFVNVITNDINHQTRGRFFNERVVFGVRVPFEGFIVIFLAVIAAILFLGQEPDYVLTDLPPSHVENLYGQNTVGHAMAMGQAAVEVQFELADASAITELTERLRANGFAVYADVSQGRSAFLVDLPQSRFAELQQLAPSLAAPSLERLLSEHGLLRLRLIAR